MIPLQGYIFVLLATLAIATSGLALLHVGSMRLESPIGRQRDGLRRGRSAPTLELNTTLGHRAVPSGGWQVLVFCHHALAEFPDLIEGLREMGQGGFDADVIILSRADPQRHDLAGLTGHSIAIAHVAATVYARFNVHVVPFISILDPYGRVQVSGVINRRSTLLRMWKEAIRLSHANMPHHIRTIVRS
jgi:hypothetical protein